MRIWSWVRKRLFKPPNFDWTEDQLKNGIRHPTPEEEQLIKQAFPELTDPYDRGWHDGSWYSKPRSGEPEYLRGFKESQDELFGDGKK